MVFIYRDLRDVVVSPAYHIESEEHKVKLHPGREYYQFMTHEQKMEAIIKGVDRFAGVGERFRYFQPWIDVDWVLALRYEDIIADPKKAATRIVDKVIQDAMQRVDGLALVDGSMMVAAIMESINRSKYKETASYRKGKSGEWRNEFTPYLCELAKQYFGKILIE